MFAVERLPINQNFREGPFVAGISWLTLALGIVAQADILRLG